MEESTDLEGAPFLDEDGCPEFEWVPGTPIDNGIPTEGLHIMGNNDEYEYNTKDEGNIVIDETDNVYDSKEDEDYDPKNDNKSAQSSRTEEEFDNTVSDTTNDL